MDSHDDNALSPGASHDDTVFADTALLTRRLLADVDATGIAVAVIASPTLRDLVFATDATAEELDEQQFTVGEGPCLDAFTTNSPETVGDIRDEASRQRWPRFSAAVRHLDARAFVACPLHIDGRAFGALEVYSRTPGAMTSARLDAVQDISNVIAETVARELNAVHDLSRPVGDHEFARGNVHVATGMVSVQLGITVDDALARLRRAANDRDVRITELAQDIVTRRWRVTPESL